MLPTDTRETVSALFLKVTVLDTERRIHEAVMLMWKAGLSDPKRVLGRVSGVLKGCVSVFWLHNGPLSLYGVS